jgi:hypothetical protein
MSSVQEIESAIQKLPRTEAEQVRRWLESYLEDQMEFTEEFKAQLAESERSMRDGTGRVHKRGD